MVQQGTCGTTLGRRDRSSIVELVGRSMEGWRCLEFALSGMATRCMRPNGFMKLHRLLDETVNDGDTVIREWLIEEVA